jgi:hypothetical protein
LAFSGPGADGCQHRLVMLGMLARDLENGRERFNLLHRNAGTEASPVSAFGSFVVIGWFFHRPSCLGCETPWRVLLEKSASGRF